MRRGKAEAQAAHASTMVFFERSNILSNFSTGTKILHIPITEEMEKWILGNYKKIDSETKSVNEKATKSTEERMKPYTSGIEKPNLCVYGGGNEIQDFCRAHSLLYVTDFINAKK